MTKRLYYLSASIAVLCAAAVIGVFFVTPLHAAEEIESGVPVSDSIPSTRTNWEETLSIPRFDATLGVLTNIEFVLTGEVNGSVRMENLDAEPAVVTAQSIANIQLERPNGEFITQVSPNADKSVSLAAFDGSIDFAGPSGSSITDIIGIEISERLIYTRGNDLSEFVGTDAIELGIKATGASFATGAGNLGLNFNTFAAASVTVTYIYTQPAIALEKATNGEDADQAPGPAVPAGDVVTWTYKLTNVGGTPLEAISLLDDREGDITSSCPQTTLDVGESITCLVTGIAQQGRYSNTAVVSGTVPSDLPGTPRQVSDQDPSHYTGVGAPAIALEKATNGEDADELPGPLVAVGDVVTWTYVVRNSGDIDLIDITLVDDREGDVSGSCPRSSLAVGEAMSCTVTGIAQQGVYTNTAVVTGTTPSDSVRPNSSVTDSDPSHYTGVGAPAIALEKATNGEDADELPGPLVAVGDVVTWTYVVRNSGEIDLIDITLVDDREGDVSGSCPRSSLAVGEAMSCTVTGIAQQGVYTNTAVVTGTTPSDSVLPNSSVTDSDPSHYTGVGAPAIALEKATNGEDADELPGPLVAVGDVVTWTYVVRNSGEIDLIDITLVDDREGDVSGSCPRSSLAVGEAMSCTVTGIAQQGVYTNTAVVTGTTPSDSVRPNSSVTDSDPSHYTGTTVALCPVDGNGNVILPALRFVGEGPGEYNVTNPDEQLVVKSLSPFQIQNNVPLPFVSTKRKGHPERVWACTGGACTFTKAFKELVELELLPGGTVLHAVVIDDDPDDRINFLVKDEQRDTPVVRFTQQSLTEYWQVELPETANWVLNVQDSIGIYLCVSPE